MFNKISPLRKTKKMEIKNKTPQRRYIKFEFFGYAPIDLAIQLHLLGKKCEVNTVGEDMEPYTEYNKAYSLYGDLRDIEKDE